MSCFCIAFATSAFPVISGACICRIICSNVVASGREQRHGYVKRSIGYALQRLGPSLPVRGQASVVTSCRPYRARLSCRSICNKITRHDASFRNVASAKDARSLSTNRRRAERRKVFASSYSASLLRQTPTDTPCRQTTHPTSFKPMQRWRNPMRGGPKLREPARLAIRSRSRARFWRWKFEDRMHG